MKWLIPLLVCFQANAATILVTDYGAVGDVASTTVTTTAGSYSATTASGLGAGAIGKIISITSAGAATSGGYRQDLVAQITNVSGTTISLNRPALSSTNSATAIYGTCSSTGIQAAINLAGNGDIVSIPAGNYLVIPPVWNTNWLLGTSRFNEAAVTIRKGGIRIVGTGNPTLTGNGAFQLSGGAVYRGYIFALYGPFTNNYDQTLSFEDMTWDGGVARGRTDDQGFPAWVDSGDGWDVTHGALLIHGDGGSPPFCTNNLFLNVRLQHWRGEMLKSGYDFVTGDFYGLTNCYFYDGNASGMNIQYGGAIVGCTFTNLIIAQENSIGGSTIPSYFLNNLITNVYQGMTVQGGATNRLPFQPYLIQGNEWETDQASIQIGPAQNVTIRSNYFHDVAIGILPGSAGGQGALNISNIVVVGNTASNIESLILVYDGSHIFATNNFMHGGLGASHFGDGLAGNGSIFFDGNTLVSGRGGLEWSASVTQWPLDLPSNNFPWKQYDDGSGVTNTLSYRYGLRHWFNTTHANTKVLFDNSSPTRVPPGATMIASNSTATTVTAWLNTNHSTIVSLAQNQSVTGYWNGSGWQTNEYVPTRILSTLIWRAN